MGGGFAFYSREVGARALAGRSEHGPWAPAGRSEHGPWALAGRSEHAPWALFDYGFRAVISTEIADIFRSNSLKIGLISIVIDSESHKWLINNPGIKLKISIISCDIELPDGKKISFDMERFARHCLLEGIDQLGYLQQQLPAIKAFEENRN